MKELSVEEKAKRYDNIIEKANKMHSENCEACQACIEELIPELAETEDERIRKALIRYFTLSDEHAYNEACGVSYRNIVAWLEKQGDKDKLIKELGEYKVKYTQEVLEKHINSISNKDDERLRKTTIAFLKDFAEQGYENAVECIDWLENQAQKPQRIVSAEVKEAMYDKPAPVRTGPIGFDGEPMESKPCEQKPADKVEPKFKVGDWVVNKNGTVHQILSYKNGIYKHTNGYSAQIFEDEWRMWDITKDAKDGDVLHSIGWHNDCIFIFNGLDNWKFDEPNGDRAVATGYCCLSVSADKMEFGIQGPDCIEANTVKPSTKIQRNLLFQKMKEAGYEWDAEKKELKKIEQKQDVNIQINPSEYINDMGGNGCYLKNTTQNHDWSEEDEANLSLILQVLWNKTKIGTETCKKLEDWLKSLKPQAHWNPSDEQIGVIEAVINNRSFQRRHLDSLYEQLKKLREEQVC